MDKITKFDNVLFGDLVGLSRILKKFFSTKEKPVSSIEMADFWFSLTPTETKYYKAFALSLLREEYECTLL